MSRKILFLILSILLIFSVIIDFNIGSLHLGIKELLDIFFGTSTDQAAKTVVLQLRLPRIVSAILVGISLPLSGLLLQTLLKNPLAGPYILGISSGASLGVAIMLLGLGLLGFSAVPGYLSVAFAGILGAALVLFLILIISLKIRDSSTILIIGIFLGSGISALVSILQYFSKAEMLKKYVIWTMGSLDGVTNQQLIVFLPVVIVSYIFSLFLVKYFDTLYLGEENAKTLGVNINFVRISIFVITGVLTGTITSFCGPIGFIGIAVPHLARMIFKTSRHLFLIITSSVIGILVMILSDILSHLFQNQIIPINTITAIWGIPIILWIVLKNKKSQV